MTDKNNATRLPTDMAGALALIDSWRIRAEAAEALVRQMRGETDELGIQCHAAQERLRLAGACVEALRDIGEQDCPYRDNCPVFGTNHGVCDGCRARRALAAWDAVPGDAKVSP
jgi:hypothetical protein